MLKCPVNEFDCDAQYRGSRCAALRAKAGADFDPKTNADRIRAMNDEEMAEQMVMEIEGLYPCIAYVPVATGNIHISRDKAEKEMLRWLQHPAEEETP